MVIMLSLLKCHKSDHFSDQLQPVTPLVGFIDDYHLSCSHPWPSPVFPQVFLYVDVQWSATTFIPYGGVNAVVVRRQHGHYTAQKCDALYSDTCRSWPAVTVSWFTMKLLFKRANKQWLKQKTFFNSKWILT